MSERYFHDAGQRAVYKLELLMVWPRHTKHKPPRYDGCSVSAAVLRVSATDGESSGSRRESYMARDTTEQAERFFLMHYSTLTKIEAREFERLAAEYRATFAASAKRR